MNAIRRIQRQPRAITKGYTRKACNSKSEQSNAFRQNQHSLKAKPSFKSIRLSVWRNIRVDMKSYSLLSSKKTLLRLFHQQNLPKTPNDFIQIIQFLIISILLYYFLQNLTDSIDSMAQFHSSIRTEYQDDEQNKTYLNKMGSFAQTNHSHSGKNLYVTKLQNILKENSKIIKQNRPIIEQLECRRKFFKKICDKQRQKMANINISVIREQYEAQLSDLKQKRNHLYDVINQLHEEAAFKEQKYGILLKNLSENNIFLQNTFDEINTENFSIQTIMEKKKNILKLQEKSIEQNERIILEKQKIERKYEFVRQQIIHLQGQ